MPHKFLDSDFQDEAAPSFHALGAPSTSGYRGLEKFPNPGVTAVQYECDEVMLKCPVTGQPDYYDCVIILSATEDLIESKSLKLWFTNLLFNSVKQDLGMFCESLAVYIREQIATTLETDEENVHVQLKQKSRGGISITART